jgi:hypothetical protein
MSAYPLAKMSREELVVLRKNITRHIDYAIDYIANLEYEIDTHRPAGYTGFIPFELFSDDEKKYLIEEYQFTARMVNNLNQMKMNLANLRTEYTNVDSAIHIESYIKRGFIKKMTPRPIVIEDSDVWSEDAFGPEIYVN